MNHLSHKIRTLREFHQYKQEYVASVLGISQSGYSKIENGEVANVSLLHIQKIADLYHLTLEQLFGWDGEINLQEKNGVGINYRRTNLSDVSGERLKRLEDLMEKILEVVSTPK